MPSRILLWSVVSALAGFLFGFDTVVISGAEQTIQSLWGLSPELHGLAMGAALYGTVLGSLIGGWPTDRFGRKPTLLWIGVLFLVGSLWSAVATCSPSCRPLHRRHRHRHLDGGRAALHLGDCAAGASRPARRDVPVQHRLRHRHRLPLELPARTASARMRGAGCSASRRSRRCSTRWPAFCIPESPRWLLDAQGRPRGGNRVLATHRARCDAKRDLAERADQIAAAVDRARSGAGLLDAPGCACRSCSRSSSRSSTSSPASTRSSTSRRASSS